jgi:hypothetical protein
MVGMVVLAAVLDAAGKDAAVAVAVAAIAVLIASYVWLGVVVVRAFGDADAMNRVRRRGRTHIAIMFGTPLVLVAAHPWGMATVALAGVMFLCQSLFTHAMIVAGLIMQRRARRTPPASEAH